MKDLMIQGAQHGSYFPTSTGHVGLTVKGFPEFVDRGVPWSTVGNVECLPVPFFFVSCLPCSGVKQDTYLWLNDTAKCIEAPPMRVDLFSILFFDTKEDLDWYNALSIKKDKHQARFIVHVLYLPYRHP